LMELPLFYVFTHDAMGDGEDGPTHQPVEQLASLRAIPGLVTLRPADANEVVEAYRYILQLRHAPAVLALSRQALPTINRTKYASAAGVAKGAYVLADIPGGKPDVILIASGRGRYCASGARATSGRRHSLTSRVDALVGDFRKRDPGIPGQRSATRRESAGRHRAGLNLRVGTVRRNDGPHHRHAHFRSLSGKGWCMTTYRV